MRRPLLFVLALMGGASFLAITALGISTFIYVLLTSLVAMLAMLVLTLGMVGGAVRTVGARLAKADAGQLEALRAKQLEKLDKQIESLETMLEPDLIAAIEERARMESDDTAQDPLSMTSQLIRLLRQESIVKQQIATLRSTREQIADFRIPKILRQP